MIIQSAAGMRKFGAEVAREILRPAATSFKKGGMAQVIALVGELGAGKTTFAQGFLKELGVGQHVASPTFLIIKRYKNIFHIDCYRLHKPQELLALGFKEILKNPSHIVLIEWPELVKKYLPKDTRWITIKHLSTHSVYSRGRKVLYSMYYGKQ